MRAYQLATGSISAMAARHKSNLHRALALVAPGHPLREGLDRILLANMGALVILGDGPDVLAICSGGFLLDAEYSPQRLSELAKMDGAIILASDTSRIARANVHLLPDAGVPTSETGTRHRTAERVARSVDVPVISISEEMSIISVYRGEEKRQLESLGQAVARATQALATLERYRSRFDTVLGELFVHEVDNGATVRDVAMALQRAEMVNRLGQEVMDFVVELGVEGRLIQLQLDELVAGLDRERLMLLRDYLPGLAVNKDAGSTVLARLSTRELLDLSTVARTVGLVDSTTPTHGLSPMQMHLKPRGYRLLARVPRLGDGVIEHVVDHFGGLPALLDSTVQGLTRVEGVGDVRARAIREGITRVVETVVTEARRR